MEVKDQFPNSYQEIRAFVDSIIEGSAYPQDKRISNVGHFSEEFNSDVFDQDNVENSGVRYSLGLFAMHRHLLLYMRDLMDISLGTHANKVFDDSDGIIYIVKTQDIEFTIEYNKNLSCSLFIPIQNGQFYELLIFSTGQIKLIMHNAEEETIMSIGTDEVQWPNSMEVYREGILEDFFKRLDQLLNILKKRDNLSSDEMKAKLIGNLVNILGGEERQSQSQYSVVDNQIIQMFRNVINNTLFSGTSSRYDDTNYWIRWHSYWEKVDSECKYASVALTYNSINGRQKVFSIEIWPMFGDDWGSYYSIRVYENGDVDIVKRMRDKYGKIVSVPIYKAKALQDPLRGRQVSVFNEMDFERLYRLLTD